jgi:hypothetical protein
MAVSLDARGVEGGALEVWMQPEGGSYDLNEIVDTGITSYAVHFQRDDQGLYRIKARWADGDVTGPFSNELAIQLPGDMSIAAPVKGTDFTEGYIEFTPEHFELQLETTWAFWQARYVPDGMPEGTPWTSAGIVQGTQKLSLPTTGTAPVRYQVKGMPAGRTSWSVWSDAYVAEV